MNIKGHIIGEGVPIVCVPVVERTAEGILDTIRQMTNKQVEMIEWRMDWFAEVHDADAVKTLLEQIKPLVQETVLLCTFRSRQQGGEAELPLAEYLALNQLVAESGTADLVDLEFYPIAAGQQCQDVIERFRQFGVMVVCSNHDFAGTPPEAEMERQLTEMVLMGADFAQLAVMPRKKTDVLRLMEAVLAVKEQHPGSHLIAMSMGGDGVISRLLGGWYGSEVTFAAFGKASAPGQIAYEEVEQILKQIQENFDQR